MAERTCGYLLPSHSPACRTKVSPNPCRKAHRNDSLFPIHYSLPTRPARRHTAPRHSPSHFPGTPENCSPQGRGDQFPGVPRWLNGQAGAFFPLTAPPAGHKFVLNPCRRAAHRNYSLFPIHYSLPTRPAWRHTAPRQTHPTPRERQRIAPRRGALTSWAWSLSRLRACGLGMSADFERKLLPAGAGGFPISWGYDKISAGAVGARFYTNKSGAKENHLCRELWVWPGRPLQNMI